MKKTSIFALIILSIIINLGFKVESYAYGPYNYFFYVTGKEIVNPVGEYKYIYTGYDKNTAKKTYYSNLELNVDEVYTFDIPEGTYNTIDEHITRNVFDVYEKKNPCVGYNDKNGNFHTYLLDNDNTIYNEKKYEWYNGNRVYIDYSNLYELCDNFLDFNYEEYCKNNSLLKNTSLITTLIIIHENEKEYLFGVVYKENYDEDIVINNSLNGWEYRLFYDFDTGEGQDAVIIEYNKNETDLVITDTVLINNTPHKITAIGHKAFTGNKNIINLQVPDSIDYIYNEAFKNCNNLEKVVLLNGNCDIAPSAFEGCSNLTTFTMPKSEYRILIYEGAFKNCSNLEQIDFIANTNWINEYTFYGCDSLKSIIIPECIEQIGFNAFQNCKNLESVTFLNKETCLGLNAFKGCENLKDIYLYKDLKGYLNSDFFENLDDINIHYLDDEQLVLTENGAIKDDLLFTIISDNEVMVRYKDDKYSNQLGLDTVVIPESIIINGKKYKVTTIEKNALPNTKNVYLPKTIKNFYMGAFYFHTYDNIYYDGSLEDFYKINKLSDDIYGNGMFGNDANGLPKKCPIFNDGSTGNYNDIKLYYKNNIGEYELYNRAIIIDKIKYVKLLSEDGVIALGLTNDGEFYDYNEDTLYILDKVVINNKEYAVTCAKDFTGYCKKVVLPSTVEIARINLRGIKEIYCNILVNTELEVGTDIHFYKTKTEIEKYYSENGGYYDYLNGKYNLFYSDQKVIKNIVIDGIMYYIVYNEETKKYETNFYVLDDTLTDIVIPDTVIIDGREYNVTGGDSETFERVRSTVKSIKLGKYVLLNDKNYNSFLRFDQFEYLK